MLTCTRCKSEKDEEDFYRDKYAKNGRCTICKKCHGANDKSPRGPDFKGDHKKRDYTILREESETGGTIIKFGDKYKAPANHRSSYIPTSSSLNSIFL